jgi:hypothetical protein
MTAKVKVGIAGLSPAMLMIASSPAPDSANSVTSV